MFRILKSFVLAAALTVGATALTAQPVVAGYSTCYTVYVWKCDCHKWVAVYRSTCYDHAYKAACKYASRGYKTCIR